MTTTVEATTRFTLGQALENRQDFADLPIGSIVQYQTSTHYRKDAPNQWTVGDRDISGPYEGSTYDDGHFILGQNYLRHIGTPPYTGPGIGVPLTTVAMFEAVPVGAVLRSRNGHRYTRTAEGYLTASGSFRSASAFRMDGRLSIETLPPGVQNSEPSAVDPNAEITLRRKAETLTRYMHRFRTTTRGAAQRAGVSIDPLDRALERLNVPALERVPGMVIDGYDYESHNGWPDGTIVVCGHPNGPAPRFAVHGYTVNRGWVRLLGEASFSGHQHTVESVPGVEAPEWVIQEYTDDQAAAILEFKKQAWTIGVKAKRDNSWCSDYEAAMMRMGITESIESAEVGQIVSAEQAAALPVGTFLRISDGIDTVLMVRDDSSPNPAKTVRLGGSLPGSWISNGMVVVGTREVEDGQVKPLRIPVGSHEEMDEMPVGTVIVTGATRYTKTQQVTPGNNRVWREGDRAYTYSSRDYAVTDTHYVVIPL